ncbi:MAG TPA: CaiB/BaiF CoA-transferase family protein [Gammaproteobacteria bacterium]|nr:CaiB/BaiF CoA-transferase family protein [Gammaproteobacteria bacterium]
MTQQTGPLRDLRILEFAGLGPTPFCGRLFADLGADVLRIDRPDGYVYDRFSVDTRGRRSVVLNLKDQKANAVALRLIEQSDALIEGFRPGVMERLGLGPDVALRRNSKLVYGRMTGFGQTGPMSQSPGHDINYVALTGALHALGPKEKPAVPLNLIGDFGGGALWLAFGIMAALKVVADGGDGQVIDCAMTDGVISTMGMIYGAHQAGRWKGERESNIIDGGAHFYNTYECADGKWIAIGSIEKPFYAALLEAMEIDDPDFADPRIEERWPALKEKLADIFATRTRDEWCARFEGTEVCYAPVLSLTEAPQHAHNQARGSFVTIDGVVQPAPLPRFSGTEAPPPRGAAPAGEGGVEALRDWGIDDTAIGSLVGSH